VAHASRHRRAWCHGAAVSRLAGERDSSIEEGGRASLLAAIHTESWPCMSDPTYPRGWTVFQIPSSLHLDGKQDTVHPDAVLSSRVSTHGRRATSCAVPTQVLVRIQHLGSLHAYRKVSAFLNV